MLLGIAVAGKLNLSHAEHAALLPFAHTDGIKTCKLQGYLIEIVIRNSGTSRPYLICAYQVWYWQQYSDLVTLDRKGKAADWTVCLIAGSAA